MIKNIIPIYKSYDFHPLLYFYYWCFLIAFMHFSIIQIQKGVRFLKNKTALLILSKFFCILWMHYVVPHKHFYFKLMQRDKGAKVQIADTWENKRADLIVFFSFSLGILCHLQFHKHLCIVISAEMVKPRRNNNWPNYAFWYCFCRLIIE